MKFTLSEWIILAVVGSVHFCCAICISLQAPFYPEEVHEGYPITMDVINLKITIKNGLNPRLFFM